MILEELIYLDTGKTMPAHKSTSLKDLANAESTVPFIATDNGTALKRN